MLLTTKEIANKEAQMILDITGDNVFNWFENYVAADAEDAFKSVAPYVPNVGYNVEYYDLGGIKSYIEDMAMTYIRSWYLVHKLDKVCAAKAEKSE